MNNNLFISHSSIDKCAVDILASLIKRVSLNQIKIWFSNDTSVDGGFSVGDNWYNSIVNNIQNSKVIVAFITPNSNDQPWILFESGYGEALPESLLVPLKFLINIDEVSRPFQHKQIHSFSNVNDANLFLSKILNIFNIEFDSDAYSSIICNSLAQMRSVMDIQIFSENQQKSLTIDNMNKKFEGLTNTLKNYIFNPLNGLEANFEVAVAFYLTKEDKRIVEYIEVDRIMTFSDFTIRVYLLIRDKVDMNTYLKTWIIQEKQSGTYLVISGVQDLIPAYTVIKKDAVYEVIYLDNPYSSIDNSSNKQYEDIDMILNEFGFERESKDYCYIREAIAYVLQNGEALNAITKMLYPYIAEKFNITPSRVERAIRHAIEIAWTKGDIETLQSFFGYTVSNTKSKPTNSEFIAMIADRIQLKIG